MKDQVVLWLKNGANAEEGVQLMIKAGAPSLTIRLIRADPVRNLNLMVSYLCKKFGVQNDYDIQSKTKVIVVERRPLSFREEFPFLNDPGCPVELEALASRKFSKYHAYVDLHKKLRDCTDLNECASVSREIINNYLENRMIWDELNYYQKHHSILGKHPIFSAFQKRKKLLSLNVKELIVKQRRLQGNIWRVKDELKKGDKPHLELDRRARLAGYEAELEEVNRLLNE